MPKKADQQLKTQTVENLKKGSVLAAFCPSPKDIAFDVQHGNEEILLLLRQHPIVNVGWIFVAVILGFLPSLFPLLFPFFRLSVGLASLFNLSWYVLLFGFILERFVMWYYNVYIITNERVIDVDFYSLLFKRVSEAKLENIEDLTGASSGVLQSLFDYGDVVIQTAAEVPEIEFERVPHPDIVRKLLSELIDLDESKGK